ncbi:MULTISPECIES: haloacid dehalogenase type II [Methylobacterium]|uniref:(S)-2-haloacid dehalogenase n=1 Tax=Methylobacterium oryzae CBMB20 TaxID=693986 RepID=A0A089QGB7_9HYPH|nr:MULTISPECIES: haloacid dehalogenase type II [Methylobacterium]AIQ93654.1 Haloacid dehalogenase, type II [Methylobacterium oryzae CBMB20]AWV14770.1 haloacid dehalogenase, type II [Methylobacterium sp. XJLW]WFS07338.1 haloacid dehalogenase type II [Methylobacterium sp. 391_Methyba4]
MTIRALVFDVFGTLVDWRSGVAREAARLLAPVAPSLDAGAFADAWRARYDPSMETVRSGARPYVDLDTLQAESLPDVLAQFGIAGVPETVQRELVQAWHRLEAWPEVPDALRRLREKHLLAPNSNGPVRLMADLARRNGLIFDAVLGAGYSRDYKPKPALYRDAVAAFGFAPAETMMVAAHSNDLAAAARHGLSTAHIARPHEHGPAGGETAPTVPVTHAARDLADLADQLGC